MDNVLQIKIKEILEKAIAAAIEAEFEEAKKIALEKVDKRKDEIIAGITLNVMKHVNIQSYGQTITIEVKTESIK